MIELTARTARQGQGQGHESTRSLKIVGIGGAGANALDRMALDGVNPAHLTAVNTDAQALTASVAGEKIQLGRNATRGLGSGGDPDLGRAAAEEASGEIRSALDGADAVFLLAGLGGGTGSGAAPVVAELAREAGALVIAVVTLPFAFEGKRRIQQAAESLAAMQEVADAVICFENDKMADAVSPKAGIQQAFVAADQTISQSVQAIAALLRRHGLVRLGFDELQTALRRVNARCLFGYGEAEGDNRPYDALARALKNPLMDKGRLLRDCETVLVQVSGGPDLTLNEVQLLMEEFNRHVGDRTRILFGTAVDPQLAGRIAVTVLSSLEADETAGTGRPPAPAPAPIPRAEVQEPKRFLAVKPAEPEPEPEPEPRVAFEVVEPEIAEEEEEIVAIEEPPVEALQPEPEPAEIEETEAPWQPEPDAPEETPERAPRMDIPVAAQASLFGDEPADAEPAPARPAKPAKPAPTPSRVSRPIPGRTLRPAAVPAPEPAPGPTEPIFEPAPEPAPEPKADRPRPVPAPTPAPAPAVAAPAAAPVVPKAPLQETLQFEPVTRGRFEKSEPTIVDGQDLDVPTFLRRNIRIRP